MILEPELFSHVWYLVLIVSIFYTGISLLMLCKPRSSSVKNQRIKKNVGKELVIRNHSRAKAYIFQWKIENLNCYWLKKKKCIKSPIFIAEALEDTKWSLELCGKEKLNANMMSVSLSREKYRLGPEFIEVKYQLAFLKRDGSFFENLDIGEDDFKRNQVGIWSMDEKVEDIFDTEKNNCIHEDTLTIQCKVWKKGEKPTVSELLSARTIFKTQSKSFVWKIDDFNFFQPDKFVVINKLKDGLIDFALVLNNELLSEKSLLIENCTIDDCINSVSFKASIVDSEGDEINCGNHEFLDGEIEKEIAFPLLFTETMLTENRNLYFPNDVLTLDCEYVFSSVTALFECASCGTSLELSNDFNNEIVVEKDKLQQASDLGEDLKSIYSSAILCDTELRTSTQAFPAHKVILSARSSVFRRMFTNDRKDERAGHVAIKDLDDETVQRMLAFIYTDSLAYLQMESASKLYTAADKYDIPSLKRRCSSFLKDNLRPISVCGVLVLADANQDKDLKSAVQRYIMEHDSEIFDSLEWKHFMAINLQLAAEVMYKRVSKNPPTASLKT